MKSQAIASGLRARFSKTELEMLLTLARHGSTRGLLSQKQETMAADLICGLETGLAELRWKQAEAKARREAPKREAERRAAREHHARIDGYTVLGLLGDWTDLSADPDHRQWVDMFAPDVQPREQGEIRRNVWRLFISKGSATSDDLVVLPGDCTMTADREEIAPLVRRIIAASQP